MTLKDDLVKQLIKQGSSEVDGKRVWDISKREFLFRTDKLVDSFLKLRSHPRYKATVIDKELELMKEHSDILIDDIIDGDFNLVDTPCGDGTKAKFFVDLLKDADVSMRYVPVNIDKSLVDLSIKRVQSEGFKHVKDYLPQVASFEGLDETISTIRNSEYQRSVVLLLGSVVASFDINDYLFKLSNAMFKGDYVIIGNGIRSGERLVNLDNYKNELFDSWLKQLPLELGFSEDDIEYDVRFNEMRVELFYKIKKDLDVKSGEKTISLKDGDELLVAFLYKFFEKELEDFCKMYFSEVKVFKDSEEEYALVLCKK